MMKLNQLKELLKVSYSKAEENQLTNCTKYIETIRNRRGFLDRRTKVFFKKYTNTLLM